MRVLAGPGTGKSYALQRKVMRLLEEGRDPKRILAVTFTNVAADALKKDLGSLGVVGADLVRARTLHSICFEILRKRQVFEITGRIPRPLMDFEKEFLLEDLKDEFGGKRKVEDLLQAYESAFARQQQDEPGVLGSPEDLKFKTQLLRWLDFHRAMLIGEVIPITHDYLRNNPAAPEFDQYDFILVDEYQDLNKTEQSLIDLLARKAELLVVGDQDQSIYSFKHAHPDGILEFPTTHAPLEDISLQICRRCPKRVVRLANELMGYFLESDHPKRLHEFEGNADGDIFAAQWDTAAAESQGSAKLIKKMISDDAYDIKPEEILILAPRRILGYALRDELRDKYGISAHTFFQEEALDSAKSQQAYATLNYLVDPEDRVALRVILGSPTVLPGTYKALCKMAYQLNLSPKQALALILEKKLEIARSDELLNRYKNLEATVALLSGKLVKEIITALFDPDSPEDIEVLLSLLNTLNLNDETTLKDLFVDLQERIRSPEVTEDAGYVRIMSLHKSKGLTSKVVFILGSVAGLIPTIKDEKKLLENNQFAEIERLRSEAKRLFFVALTRTKQYLILSSFKEISFKQAMKLGVKFSSVRGKPVAYTQASPFFSEVTKHLPQVTTGTALLKLFNVE